MSSAMAADALIYDVGKDALAITFLLSSDLKLK
jgi:hypothetical protein